MAGGRSGELWTPRPGANDVWKESYATLVPSPDGPGDGEDGEEDEDEPEDEVAEDEDDSLDAGSGFDAGALLVLLFVVLRLSVL